jgi:hypothetical protein
VCSGFFQWFGFGFAVILDFVPVVVYKIGIIN